MTARVVILNIRSGGGARAERLRDYLDAREPHTVVLTEWRDNRSGQVFAQWAAHRRMHQCSINDGNTANGVFVASQDEFRAGSATPVTADPGVLLQAHFHDWTMLGCYFPQLQAKAAFFAQCSQIASDHVSRPFMLVGDLNTGNQMCDRSAEAVKYSCADGFDRLHEKDGLVDLWRKTNGALREWTWLSHRKNGFRIDHALANPAFCALGNVTCVYDHGPRLSGLSDHSAVLIDWNRRRT